MPLDPPLRSRFQIKYVPPKEHYEFQGTNDSGSTLQNLIWFERSIREISENLVDVGVETRILDFSQDNIDSYSKFPFGYRPDIQRIYPHDLLLKDSLRKKLFQNGSTKFLENHVIIYFMLPTSHPPI